MNAPLTMPVADWRRLVNACIAEGDGEGVGHALRLMSIDKPCEASDLLEELRVGLRLVKKLA